MVHEGTHVSFFLEHSCKTLRFLFAKFLLNLRMCNHENKKASFLSFVLWLCYFKCFSVFWNIYINSHVVFLPFFFWRKWHFMFNLIFKTDFFFWDWDEFTTKKPGNFLNMFKCFFTKSDIVRKFVRFFFEGSTFCELKKLKSKTFCFSEQNEGEGWAHFKQEKMG